MDGVYLIETCESQNTTMLNAFYDDQSKSSIVLTPVRSLADINIERKAQYGDIAFTYPSDTELEVTAVL